MSKPASASAALPSPVTQLRVIVVPPRQFTGQNLEQEFSVLIKPELENVQSNGQVAHAWIGPVLPMLMWLGLSLYTAIDAGRLISGSPAR